MRAGQCITKVFERITQSALPFDVTKVKQAWLILIPVFHVDVSSIHAAAINLRRRRTCSAVT